MLPLALLFGGCMSPTTKAFSHGKINTLLKNGGSSLTNGVSVLSKHALPDGLAGRLRAVRPC